MKALVIIIGCYMSKTDSFVKPDSVDTPQSLYQGLNDLVFYTVLCWLNMETQFS